MLKSFISDELNIRIYKNRTIMGNSAAKDISNKISELLKKQEWVNIIFAAAPSQLDMFESLIQSKNIDWSRVNAFHMDEYIGLSKDASQGFGNFLREHLFSKLPFRSVNYIDSTTKISQDECERYTKVLKDNPADIVCMGIGENGHIAFNDPHVAIFDDKETVKVVNLDEKCRMQQVNDGCFKCLEDVPKQAITLTIPTLVDVENIFCIVPGKTKREAVFNTIRGNVTTNCPASILRKKRNSILYTDKDSGWNILFRKAVFTDEISQDFEVACQLASQYQYEAVEIRSIWDKPPHILNDLDINEIKRILNKYGLKVCSIASPVFKCAFEDFDSQIPILERCINLANELGAKYIRVFPFLKDKKLNIKDISSKIKTVEYLLNNNDLLLLVESDPHVNTTNGKMLSELLQQINSKHIKAIWDPGNDIYDPEKEIPYPNGYEIIKDLIKHIHIKDCDIDEKDKPIGVCMGKGLVDYYGQFKALLLENYDGFISLESHYRKKAISDDLIKNPSGSAFSEDGYESTEECMIEMEKILEKVVNSF